MQARFKTSCVVTKRAKQIWALVGLCSAAMHRKETSGNAGKVVHHMLAARVLCAHEHGYFSCAIIHELSGFGC
eukprot:3502589-Amphidinium_carterae.1